MGAQEGRQQDAGPMKQHHPALMSAKSSDLSAGARAVLSVDLGKIGAPLDSGEARIRQLGYKQELQRNFGVLSNAALGFTVVSIITGITASFSVGYTNGGPVAIVYGWLIVSVFSLCVAACMAEITSSLPISGGPYYWSVELAKGTGLSEAFVGWITGWLNLLGQIGLTASVASCSANHIAAMWVIYNGHVFEQEELLLTYALCLICQGCINMMPPAWIARFFAVTGTYQFLASLVLIIIIPLAAPTHQSAAFVFGDFDTSSLDSDSIPSAGYLFILGMLMSQYTISGYDSCAHLSEETKSADRNAAWGILAAVSISVVLGLGYILALLFSIQDPSDLFTGAVNGYASGQILYDIAMARWGSVNIALGFMCIPLLAIFFCGAACVTSNSRMLYSFSRDGGIPFHRLWSSINEFTQTPLLAVWAMVCMAFLLGLPMLSSSTAFSAVVSISTIGLYLSYGIPIAMRILAGSRFEPGPFSLGRWSPYLGWIAVSWVGVITVAFVLPTSFPVTSITLNYAGVAVAIVLLGAVTMWILPYVGARHWYRGELKTYIPEPEPIAPRGPAPKRRSMAGKGSSGAEAVGQSPRSSGSGRRLLGATKLTLMDLIVSHQSGPDEGGTIGGSSQGERPGSYKATVDMPRGSGAGP